MLGSEVWHASKYVIYTFLAASPLVPVLLLATGIRLESTERVLIVRLVALATPARISRQMRQFILGSWRWLNWSSILIETACVCSLVILSSPRHTCIILPIRVQWVRASIHYLLVIVVVVLIATSEVERVLYLLWPLPAELFIARLGVVLQVLVQALATTSRPVVIVTLVAIAVVVVGRRPVIIVVLIVLLWFIAVATFLWIVSTTVVGVRLRLLRFIVNGFLLFCG